ncbi:LytR family transcriptional regulator [Halobacillus fulvus]|nr:LytR family transcriptional regulator [Halobacillus fulvus]
MTTRKVRKRRRIKKRKRRILVTFLLFLGILIGGGAYYATQVYTATFQGLERGEKSALRDEAVDIGKDPISVLLLGVEDYSSHGAGGRADTIIVMTLDPDTKEMTMTSIPRDTRVDLPADKVGEQYAGSHKINAAYSLGEISGYGAEKLTVETVEEYLDIPIDKYAKVNFEAFVDVVEIMDGVTIDVKEGFSQKSHLNSSIIEFDEGPTKMTGEEALAFVRMRKHDAAVTYPRDERQRQFIKASIDEAISAGTLFKLGEISDVLGKNVSTNLSPREIFAIQKAFSSEESSVETIKIDGENSRLEDGLYYFTAYEESLMEVKAQLQTLLDYKHSEPETDTTESSY